MVSTLNLEEKFNRVRRNFCFYLDVQDHGLGRSLSRRLQDMGLQQEVFLTSRVTHVVRDVVPHDEVGGAGAAAGARLRPHHSVAVLTVPKAISLLDKLYDTFFAAPRKSRVRYFNKHYIKIEFLDKVCRPVFKEFDSWPMISLEPDPPKRERRDRDPTNTNNIKQNHNGTGLQKMTRKSRPRTIDKEEKEPKGGYCEMCNADFTDAASHRLSAHHLAFVRDHSNFLALDTLIGAGADVETFLNKTAPLNVNGERRSLRNMCNGDVDHHTVATRSKQHSPEARNKLTSPTNSPDSTLNGDSPKRHGKRDEAYYKVVSTKLRSSGGFVTKQKPQCNGNSNLVVKFKKVRRSELSVLSDEAEQFMFPKRASSTSSTSSDEDDHQPLAPRRKTPQPAAPVRERQRSARPVALKEESSEEDIWPEVNRRKRRPAPVNKRGRRIPLKKAEPEPVPEPEMPPQAEPTPIEEAEAKTEPVSPLREEPIERCMKWEDGKLKYTPAVEQLEFAFESVPQTEPWYETFKRQDQDKVVSTNIPEKFALYAKSPKLPYEIEKLPPLKPNCCPLSDLVKRDEKPGPTRSYGTRGMKNQKQTFRKRTSVTNIIALEGLARKSPREHASTLAILGSAGLLNRRKNGADDNKSTASEDTTSDTTSNLKVETVVSETQASKERLQQFFSEVFEDAEDYEVPDEAMEGDAAVTTSTNIPDVSSLMSECESCELIRNELKENQESRAKSRRGKFKKKNRTGWPSKKKSKKGSRTNSEDSKVEGSLDRSSAEPPDDETRDTISEEELNTDTETDKANNTLTEKLYEDESVKEYQPTPLSRKRKRTKTVSNSSNSIDEDSPETTGRTKREKRSSRHSTSEEREKKAKKKRAMAGLLLQPVVRVARVDPNAARRLRSASKGRSSRLR